MSIIYFWITILAIACMVIGVILCIAGHDQRDIAVVIAGIIIAIIGAMIVIVH